MPRIKMRWKFWLAWCVPAVAMVAIAQFTPDAITEVGHPGTFLTAIAYPGGWLVPDTTVVQTSHATLVLEGTLSSERGQPVTIRDTTRQGLVACTGSAGCLP
ncbi:MAG: hypothetical protein ACRES9_01450, partial [Gammaproteobacteria bacterium]